jgi:hypothetical protein
MRPTHEGVRVVLAAAILVLVGYGPGVAAVQVARGDDGLTVSASGAPLHEVLQALAAEGDFSVTMREEMQRPVVDVHVHEATLERALRAVLRGHNYVIGYEQRDDGLAVSRVEVMLPRAAEAAAVDPRDRSGRVTAELRRVQQQQRAAERRAAEMRAASLAQRREARAVQAARRVQPQPQAQPEPVPLRRLLWQRR